MKNGLLALVLVVPFLAQANVVKGGKVMGAASPNNAEVVAGATPIAENRLPVLSGGNVVKQAPADSMPVITTGSVVMGGAAADEPAVIAPGRIEKRIQIETIASDFKDVTNWCEYRGTEESFADLERGYYGFVIKKGSLTDNVQRFIDQFYPSNQGLVDRIGEHQVIADMCLIEKSRDLIVQKLIAPYAVDKKGVLYGDFLNGIHALFYQGDKEFSRYVTGVR